MSNETTTTTTQPIICVSRGGMRLYSYLLSEKGGKATYCFCDPREASEHDIFSRPIDEFHKLYAPASSLNKR